MLDLRIIKEKTYDIILFDGSKLSIRRPSQKMVVDMMGYEDTLKSGSNNERLNALTSIIKDILNNNTSGKKFNEKYVKDNFSVDIAMAFIQEFMDFVTSINSNPN